MVEKIYDTLKAILWTEFPKNNQGVPFVYNRIIQNWFFGDRTVQPSALGVVLRGTTESLKDLGFGLREISWSVGITFYSSNDDKETSERVVQEYARIAHEILKKHRTMWICDLCPFCDLFPLSPIHYIDNGIITNVGITTAIIPAGLSSYIITVPGTNPGIDAPAVIRLTPGISGNVTVSEILSCGLGITQTTYSDLYTTLAFTLSNGTPHTGYSTNILNIYAQNVVNQVNSFWAETHLSGTPPYYDWPGVAYNAVQEFISDWAAGIQSAPIVANNTWNKNLNSVIYNDVNLMRLLQNVQVGEITPSDDGMEAAMLHSAKFTMKGKEVISVDAFGPNNVDVNAV